MKEVKEVEGKGNKVYAWWMGGLGIGKEDDE